ncbi:MAG TPA: hypothetical protein EYQ61_03285 [Dehalococcoidia bacterium]|jgi:hypothetical protein|nr:hypothetical protein [Dehalococcoidia bacterium]
MADKRPSSRDMDADGDGITGHESGMANQGLCWVSENTGKIILAVIVFITVIFVVTAIQDANAAKEEANR